MNALLQGAMHGVSIEGATLYCTSHPCALCAKMLINCGVQRIVTLGDYPDDLAKEMLKSAGVTVNVMEAGNARRTERRINRASEVLPCGLGRRCGIVLRRFENEHV